MQALLDLGADVDGADGHGWTALQYAARYGEMDCVQLLLSVGWGFGAAYGSRR